MNKMFIQNGNGDFFSQIDNNEKWLFRKPADVNNDSFKVSAESQVESLY